LEVARAGRDEPELLLGDLLDPRLPTRAYILLSAIAILLFWSRACDTDSELASAAFEGEQMRPAARRRLIMPLSAAAFLLAATVAASVGGGAPATASALSASPAMLAHPAPPSHSRPDVPRLSPEMLSRLSRLLHQDRAGSAVTFPDPSSNWAGYIDPDENSFVSASWTQPAISCTSAGGAVVFWVGIGGVSVQALLQIGTGAECEGGSPVYFAWWEYVPSSMVQFDETVAPGDEITAQVEIYLHNYGLVEMTDSTQGWVKGTLTAPPPDAGAEVITEAPFESGILSPLANFNSVQYTGAIALNGTDTDDSSLQSNGAESISMVDPNGGVAIPSSLDSTGEDFTVTYYS
jgi:hypothetical protein